MIIHEYTNYYDKDLTNDFKENLVKYLKDNDKMNINGFQDIKNLLMHGSESDKKSIIQMAHAMINNGMNNHAGSRKQRNSLFQFVKELGINEKDFYDKYRPTNINNDNINLKDAIKQTKSVIQSKNKEKVRNALKQQLSYAFLNPSKERYQISDKLTIADNKLDDRSRELRKKTVMKEWEQRNQKWKAKHDQERKRKMLVGGIGLTGAGTAYIAARKLAKLKGLENKYARKLLLLPPNKRNFVQKMLDKIRALIRKYKH